MTADNFSTLWVSMGVENGQLYVSCELLLLGIVAQGATLRGTGVWGPFLPVILILLYAWTVFELLLNMHFLQMHTC